MAFLFHEQNKIGLKGEELILQHYRHQPLTKMSVKSVSGDFLLPDGRIMEIKTDTYPLARTENFFMEFYSNQEKKTPGGPWRAFLCGTDIFLYLFATDLVYFEFDDVQRLVYRCDELVKKKKLKPQGILNPTHRTTGYKIAREWLEDLYVEHKIITTTEGVLKDEIVPNSVGRAPRSTKAKQNPSKR